MKTKSNFVKITGLNWRRKMLDIDHYLKAKQHKAETLKSAAETVSEMEEVFRWEGVLEVITELKWLRRAEKIEDDLGDYL
tara:strand:- start:8443 stop:8682 length:240 start_codon:yes stop_codon:yes gene_type:complete